MLKRERRAVEMSVLALVLLAIAVGGPAAGGAQASGPRNFVFFNLERERITEVSFLDTDTIIGAQLKYTWRELEPERDRYRFDALLSDLAFLERHGKRLFVQLQDVSFDDRVNVPEYLRDPEFGGGVARKYEVEGEGQVRFDGWVARRWDRAVLARFRKLLLALAGQIDGRVEGVTLAETAVGFGDAAGLRPSGYTPETYADGVIATMSAAREGFQRSRVIQYANFMPGEWLPWEDHGYLRRVYAHAELIGVGVGGPDVLPHRPGQRNHSYGLIAARGSTVVAGLAVQDGNLADRNPATGNVVTPAELYRFARGSLRLDYLFWGAEEPLYTDQVLPFLRGLPAAE